MKFLVCVKMEMLWLLILLMSVMFIIITSVTVWAILSKNRKRSQKRQTLLPPTAQDFLSVIVTVTKPGFLIEFLEHCKQQGVDHVYILNHQRSEDLLPYQTYITFLNDDTKSAIRSVWTVHLDSDEFIYGLRTKLSNALRTYRGTNVTVSVQKFRCPSECSSEARIMCTRMLPNCRETKTITSTGHSANQVISEILINKYVDEQNANEQNANEQNANEQNESNFQLHHIARRGYNISSKEYFCCVLLTEGELSDEFIEHYLMQGVDHIFVCGPQPKREHPFVTHFSTSSQAVAETLIGMKSDYILYASSNLFLYGHDKPFVDLLTERVQYTVPSYTFGSSGHMNQPRTVRESHIQREPTSGQSIIHCTLNDARQEALLDASANLYVHTSREVCEHIDELKLIDSKCSETDIKLANISHQGYTKKISNVKAHKRYHKVLLCMGLQAESLIQYYFDQGVNHCFMCTDVYADWLIPYLENRTLTIFSADVNAMYRAFIRHQTDMVIFVNTDEVFDTQLSDDLPACPKPIGNQVDDMADPRWYSPE